MSPISVIIVAMILVGLVLGWWRKFSILLTLVLVNLLAGFLTLADFAGVLTDLAGHPYYLSAEYWPRLYTIFTSMFLHAGPAHLIGNMIVLFLLGIPFEDRVGRGRLLVIYFFGGAVGFLAHAIWSLAQPGPAGFVVGASGAVFAVLGGFATLYPRDKVHFPIIFIIRMPVVVGAMILMAMETVYLVGVSDHISHAAHIGGAAGGVVAALLLGRPEQRKAALTRVDYARLEQLTDDRGREFVTRMKENADVPEFHRAWFERLLPRLSCPTCQKPLQEACRARLRCPEGHEVHYEG